ncbi:MAG: ribonuclease P protein component, partial [Clostridia bacterium]|nr:ribonuclease P protein component [Clostridia bacterium]
KNMVLIYLNGKEQRFGFSVSAKVGKAVTRNRLRRWMREEVRMMRYQLKCGKYIFVARNSMGKITHEALAEEMRNVLSRAKLVRNSEPVKTEAAPCETSPSD